MVILVYLSFQDMQKLCDLISFVAPQYKFIFYISVVNIYVSQSYSDVNNNTVTIIQSNFTLKYDYNHHV